MGAGNETLQGLGFGLEGLHPSFDDVTETHYAHENVFIGHRNMANAILGHQGHQIVDAVGR